MLAARKPRTSSSLSRLQPHRHRAGADRGQHPPRIQRRQDEQRSRRRLLQQLQQGVRRLRARLLRHQPIGLADDEHPAAAFHRRQRRAPLQQPHAWPSEWLAMPSGARVERPPPPLLHDPGQRLGRLLHLLVRIRPPWGGGSARTSARPHAPGRRPAGRLGRRRRAPVAPLAEDELCQPERQPLLSDAGRPGEKHHLRQPVGAGGFTQPLAGLLVSDQVRQ